VATADAEPRRIEPVRRRVAVAKAVLAIGAAAAFGGAVALSRWHNSGHSKQPLRPLAPSRRYREAVHTKVGTPGIIDPPIASPSAATHVS
jgi:Ni,Fe-hydrogenase I small subunit